MTKYRLTHAEIALLRKYGIEEGMRNSRGKRFVIEVGERCSTTRNSMETSINIYLLTDDRSDDWEDTDLFQTQDWPEIRKAIQLSSDGLAMIDFYIYEMEGRERGDLCSNIQALIDEKGLKEIHANRPVLWRRD